MVSNTVPSEYTRISRSAVKGSLDLIRAHYVTYEFPRHMHETYVFCVIERGVETLRMKGQDDSASDGQIIVINPGVIHQGAPASTGGYYYRGMYPSPQMLQEAAAEVGSKPFEPYFARPILDDLELGARLRAMIVGMEGGYDSLESEFQLTEWLVDAVVRHGSCGTEISQPSHGSGPFRRARDYIHAHFSEPISLQDIAQVAGLSPYQLSRIFERHLGVPPHAYCTNVRINYAKKLLRDGCPIGEVAIESGFTDQSHLTRWFKRVVGVTPGRYC